MLPSTPPAPPVPPAGFQYIIENGFRYISVPVPPAGSHYILVQDDILDTSQLQITLSSFWFSNREVASMICEIEGMTTLEDQIQFTLRLSMRSPGLLLAMRQEQCRRVLEMRSQRHPGSNTDGSTPQVAQLRQARQIQPKAPLSHWDMHGQVMQQMTQQLPKQLPAKAPPANVHWLAQPQRLLPPQAPLSVKAPPQQPSVTAAPLAPLLVWAPPSCKAPPAGWVASACHKLSVKQNECHGLGNRGTECATGALSVQHER
jgi:hypothetical protein